MGLTKFLILFRYGSLLRVISASAFITFAILQTASAQQNSETWPRLPDGRVVIEVKGFKVALPAQGSDLDDISFPDENYPVAKKMTLRQVIATPGVAKQAFSQASYVSIRLPNLPERGGLFLNRFQRSDFRSYSGGLGIGAKAANICKDEERQRAAFLRSYEAHKIAEDGRLEIRLGDDTFRVQARVTPNGWLEFKNADGNATYCRVGESDDAGQTLRFARLSCGTTCSVTICIGDVGIFSFSFSPDTYREPEWLALIARAKDVIRYITEF